MKDFKIEYPWNEAPIWAKWAATDEKGEAYWFQVKPVQSAIMWQPKRKVGQFCKIKSFTKLSINVDWKKTLQKRPINESN